MSDREERLEEALLKIKQWADAYPQSIFRPLSDNDLKLAQEALRKEGIDMGAMHAGWARHILDGIGEILRDALK